MNSVSGAWRKGYGGRERESAQEQLTTVHVAQRLAPQASRTLNAALPHLPLGTGVGTMPPCPSGLAPHGPIVTNSSAAVGWMAQAWSKSACAARGAAMSSEKGRGGEGGGRGRWSRPLACLGS